MKGGIGMATAFVLITSEIGAEQDIMKRLRKMKNVEEAYVVVDPTIKIDY
jgi:hypothetical protein